MAYFGQQMYGGRRPEDELYEQLQREAAIGQMGAPGGLYGGSSGPGGPGGPGRPQPTGRRQPRQRTQTPLVRGPAPVEEPSGWEQFAEVAAPILGMGLGAAIGGPITGGLVPGMMAGTAVGSATSEGLRMTRDPRAQTQPNRMGDILASGATGTVRAAQQRPQQQQSTPPPQSSFAQPQPQQGMAGGFTPYGDAGMMEQPDTREYWEWLNRMRSQG